MLQLGMQVFISMGQWVDQKQSIELSQISREKKGDANELRL
jgi:hypothetical protein